MAINSDDFDLKLKEHWLQGEAILNWIENGPCFHKWQPTTLLTSIVYNCKHCGIKKEEVCQSPEKRS